MKKYIGFGFFLKKNYSFCKINIKGLFRSVAGNFSCLLLVAGLLISSSNIFAQITQRGSATTATTTTGSLSLTMPTGIVAGDVMVAVVFQYSSSSTAGITLPLGWTDIANGTIGANSRYARVFYKVATSSSEPALSVTLGNGTTRAGAGSIVAFYNVNSSSVINAAGSAFSVTNTSGTSATASTITTVSDNSAILMFAVAGGTNNSRTWNNNAWSTTTSPGTLTELADAARNYASAGIAWANQTSKGATGNGSATLNANQAARGGLLVALNYAPTQYRSIASGNWNSASTWQVSTDGGNNWSNATNYPTATNNSLTTIQSGHTVSLAQAETVSSLTVNGTLDVNTYLLTGSGVLNANSGAGVLVGSTSNFPAGFTSTTLNANSTVNYDYNGAQTVASLTFGNLTLSGGGTKTLPAALTTINGNFTVDNCTTTAQSALTIGGSVYLNNGYNATWGAFTHNVGGSWQRNGYGSSTFTGSTINFTGSTAATLTEVGYSNSLDNLTISKSGTLSLGAGLAITGNLNVNNGATFNLLGYNLTVGGDVTLNTGSVWNATAGGAYSFAGNFTNNATTFTASTGTHTFTGTSKLFSGSTTITNLTLSGSYTNSGTLNIDGTFGGGGSLINTGTLSMGGDAWNINLDASAVGNTVNYTGSSAQTLRPVSYYNLTLLGSGQKTFPSALNIANNLSIYGGTVSDLGSNFVHSANQLLLGGVAQASSTYGGTGSAAAVINSTYFTSSTGIINTSNTWTGVTNTDWNTASNWSKNAVPTASVAAFIPNVTNKPVINSAATCLSLNVLANSSVTINGSNSLTVSGSVNNAGTITLNSGTFSISGSFTNSGTLTTNTGTVVYDGAAQTVAGVNYYNLTLAGSGVKTLQSGTTAIGGNLTLSGTASATAVAGLTVTGDISLGAGTTFIAGNYTHNVAGNWYNNGATFTGTGSTIQMTGTNKTIGGSSSTAFNNLTNNGGGILNLGVNTLVNGTLALNSGIFKLDSYNLTLGSASTITSYYYSNTSMIVADGTGEIRKVFTGNGSFTFPVGDNSDGGANYSPVTVNLTAGTYAGAYVGVRVSDVKHPNNGATSDYLTRYWSISQSGISGMSANVTATYLPEDVVGSEPAQTAMRYSGSAWSAYSTLGSNTLTATAVNAFGDFTGFAVQKLYRSKTSGNWNSTATWEYSIDGNTWGTATSTPSNTDDGITIQSGHTVTVTANVTTDQTSVNAGGQLTVNNGVTLTLNNGTGTDLIVNGTLVNAGTVTTNGTLSVNSGGTYQHSQNGGTIPTAIWDANSTCLITGVTGTVPSGLTQSFGNFTWNCAGQTADLSLGAALNTINGNFTMQSTSGTTYSLSLGGSVAGNLSVQGDYIQTGGVLRGNYAQAAGANRTMTVAGNFSVSGGTFDLTASTGNYYMTVNVGQNFTHSAGTITETGNSTSSGFVFNGGVVQTYTSGGTISNTVNFTVNSGTTLQMAAASTTVNGAGSFTLSSGATLGVTSTTGIVTGTTASGNIRVTGTRTYSAGASYIYNGAGGAQSAGNGLTQNVPANLTINNASGVSLSAATTISGVLTMTTGNLTTTTTNLLTLTSTDVSAVSGGGSSSFVNGPLRRTLPASSAGGGTYVFPVGAGTVYRPFSLVNPQTGTGTVTAQVQTVTASTGGTFDATLSAKSTAEYWLLTTAGNFTNSSASIERPTAISPFDAVATSTTMAGTYTNLFGTASTYGVANSASFSGTGARYFVFGQSNPGIYSTVTSLSGFTYKQNLGPSAVQNFSVGGVQLSENLHLEMKRGNFEISSSNSPYTGVVAINLPIVSGTVATTPIYVRLKAGLAAGNYTDTIYVSSTGYTQKIVTLTGTVTASPNVTVTPTTLSLGSYNFGGGPTTAQNITITASRLSGAVTVTPPAGFEIKLNTGSTYQTTALTIAANYPASGSDSITATVVNVRMAAGLGSGIHSGNIVLAASGATNKTVAVTGSVNPSASILNSTSYLGAFIYTVGSGPSAIQGFQLKVTNLNAGSTVTVTPPTSGDYAISRTRNDADFQTTALTFTNQSGTFTDSIFVRLVAGRSVNTYGPEGVIITASGAVTKSVACLGKVVNTNTPTVYASENMITGLGYQATNSKYPPGILNGGPSNAQKFVLSGTALTNPVSITAPTGFEVSFSPGSGFATTLNIPVSGVLQPRVIYVRMISGLIANSYSGDITIASSGASQILIPINSAKVYSSPLVEANGAGEYCTGSTINLTSTGGSELGNRFWEGPNNYYSTNSDITLTNVTAAQSGDYVVTANVVVGGNLVYNGDFELGNVGFGSAYGYPTGTFNTNSLVPEGLYAITTTGSTVHYNFNTVADHTPAPGTLQMIVNGNTNAGAVVWSQNVSVLPDADYQFTYWLQTVVNGTDGAPSKLQLYINGVAAGPIYTANPASGNWAQYVYNTNSGSATALNLELINQTTAAGGNDFSLDDIELHQVLYAKDTAAVVIGSALPVSVTIAASQNPATSGVPVTLTATPVNGGLAPVYKWVIGTDTVQSSSSPTLTRAFTTTTTVKCILVSSLKCVTGNPANSSITITVNAVVNPNYWWGFQSTDWSNPSNWTDNRVPAAGEDVIYATVANNVVPAYRDLWVDNSRIVGSVINATNRKLVIPPGKQLIVNNNIDFTNKSDTMIVIKANATDPNGTLIFNNAQNNPVYATVEMYSKATWNLSMPVNQKYNWQFFGIPLSTLVASPTLDKSYVRQMLEEKDNINNHWELLNNNSVMTPFRGYEICQEVSKTYTFRGRINNYNYASGQLVKTTTGSPLYPGQHLLANSYTAAIKVKNIEFGSDMEQTVYIYNTGTYSSWQGQTPTTDSTAFVPGQYNSVPKNQAGVAGLLLQVPSMSAFLVRINKTVPASTANCYVNINYSAAVVRNVEKQRVGAVQPDTAAVQGTSTIRVVGENGADKLWLMTRDDYSDSYDNGYDGYKIEGLATNPQLYAYSNGDKLQINSVPDMNNTALIFRAGQDTEYKLVFNHDSNVVSKYNKIFIHDLKTNTITDVTASGAEYSFTASSSEGAVVRFRMLASKITEGQQKQLHSTVYVNNRKIYVQNLSDANGRVYVYDITGKVLGAKNMGAYGNVSFEAPYTESYIIKRVIGDKIETSKIMLP